MSSAIDWAFCVILDGDQLGSIEGGREVTRLYSSVVPCDKTKMNSFHVRLAFLLLHYITITTLTSALICPKTNGKDTTDVTGRLNALVKANP